MKKVTLIPGDGIGPEVSEAVVKIFHAANAPIEFEKVEAGSHMIETYGAPIHTSVIEAIKKNKVALKGPITTPIGKGFKSVNVTLRQALKLYANLRPVKSIPGIKTRYENIDLIIVRENTEDLYMGIESMGDKNTAESTKRITRVGSEKIAKFACEIATKQKRKKITSGHKANIMKLADGLFISSTKKICSQYENIQYEEQIIDALCMNLVMKPEAFDVILLPNLYGDIVSDLCAGFVGGLGLIPSGNLGDDYALFEAVHGSAPDIAGQNLANPTALLQSSIMMLRHLEEYEIADQIENAIFAVYKEGQILTRDIGGTASTTEFTQAVIDHL